MKTLLSLLVAALLVAPASAPAAPPEFLLEIPGALDAEVKETALAVLTEWNERAAGRNADIVAENARRAAETPPLPAFPLLTIYPVASDADIKASYAAFLVSQHLNGIHERLAALAAQKAANSAGFEKAFREATPAARAAAIQALRDGRRKKKNRTR